MYSSSERVKQLTGTEGQRLIIVCTATGSPPISYEFFKVCCCRCNGLILVHLRRSHTYDTNTIYDYLRVCYDMPVTVGDVLLWSPVFVTVFATLLQHEKQLQLSS